MSCSAPTKLVSDDSSNVFSNGMDVVDYLFRFGGFFVNSFAATAIFFRNASGLQLERNKKFLLDFCNEKISTKVTSYLDYPELT